MKYFLQNDPKFGNLIAIGRWIDDSKTSMQSIPINPDNIDYQKYLEWVAEGNTPEPADE